MLPNSPLTTTSVLRATRRTLLLAGMIASTAAAYAQSELSDSQVESNVLRSLASSPELANESITTRTTAGTVTLSGTVRDEYARRRAENLAANTIGVKKVIDELTLASSPAAPSAAPAQTPPPSSTAAPMVLQSDGTYAPEAEAVAQLPPQDATQRNNPDSDQTPNAAPTETGAPQAQPPYSADAQTSPAGRRPMNQGYPYPPAGGYPPPSQQGSYPNQGAPQPYPPRYPQNQQPVYGGQAAGQPVLIPAGALVRVRVNRTLSSDKSQPGTTFDGIVVNDVSAGGFVAIPRGAAVQGTVVDSKSSGALKGRGELSIQLTQVTLAGRPYSIVTDVWAHNGGDKTIETVNKTAGFGAAGLIIGAIAGGGTGAAIGGGVGAAAGLGSSAASGRGQVYIPSEGLVTFHLAQDAHVDTVSEQEMQRLAYGVAPGADPRYLRTRPAPRVYVGPGYPPYYYPGPYGPYGYPRY